MTPTGEIKTVTYKFAHCKKHGGERYVIAYEDKHYGHAINALQLWALNPHLSFTWDNYRHMANQIMQSHLTNPTY